MPTQEEKAFDDVLIVIHRENIRSLRRKFRSWVNVEKMRILLISGTGLLGSVLARSFEAAGIPFFATTRRELNLELPVRPQIEPILRNGEFTHVILCAAMADLGECFRDPQRSLRVNLLGPIEIGRAHV